MAGSGGHDTDGRNRWRNPRDSPIGRGPLIAHGFDGVPAGKDERNGGEGQRANGQCTIGHSLSFPFRAASALKIEFEKDESPRLGNSTGSRSAVRAGSEEWEGIGWIKGPYNAPNNGTMKAARKAGPRYVR